MLQPSTYSSNRLCPERVNWSVNEFCKAHGIGRTLFYEEVSRGEIVVIKVGSRTLIPADNARDWLKRKVQHNS